MVNRKKTIVVAGDIAIDWIGWEKKAADTCFGNSAGVYNWKLWPGIRLICQKGGVLLLSSFLKHASWPENEEIPEIITHLVESPEIIPPTKIIHSTTILREFPSEKGKKDMVWRVKRYCGFSGPETFTNYILKDDPPQPDIVVLDDCGNGFRDHPEAWPAALREGSGSPLIVLKMSRPLAIPKSEGKLWNCITQRNPEKLVVIISAKDLRESGIFISHRLSWERTVADLLWQLRNNSELVLLASRRHLIVRFGNEGVLYYQNINGTISADLFYMPQFSEDGASDHLPGLMQGVFDSFTAVLVTHLTVWNGSVPAAGIKEGLAAQWRLQRHGFGKDCKQSNFNPMYSCIFHSSDNDPKIARIHIPESLNYFYDPAGKWTILDTVISQEIKQIAKIWIQTGKSSEIDQVPVGSWGKLITIDRLEIECYQSIRNLIGNYILNRAFQTPLCISVFGPPGSGKSFGVKQIAASIDSDSIKEMVFNLSQVGTPDSLPNIFHKIRDESLKGKTPLVFFDEFDTKVLDQQFGWLKHFLAPMQDGEFWDGDGTHPIGKAIFIFAGGTCKNFDEFSKLVLDDNLLPDIKGPDFISRLKGYVNIKGCNQSRYDDDFYILRRGMLIRSLLEREAPHLLSHSGEISIDDAIIRAFLNVKEFRHGARSIEAIIRGSSLTGKRIFDQSALPPKDQLCVHLDAEEFTEHLLGDLLKRDFREIFAQKLHEKWHENDLKESPKSSKNAYISWSDMSEDMRDSNRQRTDDLIRKLRKCGYTIRPSTKSPPEVITFSKEEIELMAIMEHERWMDEKKRKGWRYAPVKDEAAKKHPCIIDWEKLSDIEKDKDRKPLKVVAKLLADSGIEIVR